MRYQGKITSWKDDQGFGFITPNGGGEQVFLHIKAFARRGRRPVEGAIVTYELVMDAKGRARAESVAFVESTRSRVATGGGKSSGSGLPMLAVLFFVFVGACALAGKLPVAVVGLYVGASLLAFAVYAWDKSAARGGHWRTAESTLHMIALFGGWPGALVAQRVLRHKSSKASFQRTFWATVLINCGVLAWSLTAKGAGVLHSVLAGVA
ncbi:MAG: DUF1294 domain-containing protein [Azonexaceae bacterium]|nr:DUF1294 domain-containing protein [Azonexaceae bacterium]